MASTVQLSGFRAFYFRSPQPKTLALPLASSSVYSPEASSLRSILLTTRRRWHVCVRSTTSGNLVVNASIRKLSETELVPIPSGSDGIEGLFPPGAGVYGVYDKNGDLQFIGISRNVVASIAAHSKMVPVLCCSVKVGLVDGDNHDKAVLTDAWKSWLEEHLAITGKIPPGNQSGNNTWVRRPQTKPDLRLTHGRHVQLSVSLDELIDRLVKENEVVAFIKGSRSAPNAVFHRKLSAY